MMNFNQRHKSFFLTSVGVGALCLLFYVYLCVLQTYTHSQFVNSEQKVYTKPLTDAERVAECSMSEACSLLAEMGTIKFFMMGSYGKCRDSR